MRTRRYNAADTTWYPNQLGHAPALRNNSPNIKEETENQAQVQAIFGRLGVDGPAAIRLPFARPFHVVRNESANQTETARADQ